MEPNAPVYAVWIPGQPRPWKRHVAGGRTHPVDMAWRVRMRAGWLEQVGCLNLTGPCELTVVFVGANPRMDLDNGIKGVLEALQGTCWPDGVTPAWWDDNQVRVIAFAASVAPQSRCTPDAGVWLCVRPLD